MEKHKRKYERLPVIILVDLFTATSSLPKGRACIVNLSLGGLAPETEAELEKGTELFLRVNLGGGHEPLELHADVVRQQRVGNVYRYGVKYTGMNIVEKFKLRSYIRRWIKSQKK